MRVVLLDNVRGIGHIGDVKDVADGYARNFLLKRGLARAAGPGAEQEAAVLVSRRREASALAHRDAEALAERLSGIPVSIAGHANEKGTLFAAVDEKAIASAVSAAAGMHISPEHVRLPEHIKTIGDHQVTLQLADGVTAAITVTVTR